MDFKKYACKERLLFISGCCKLDEADHVSEILAADDCMILMIHFLDFREILGIPDRELREVGSALKGNGIFSFTHFHDDIP